MTICLVLLPQRSLLTNLKDRNYSEKMNNTQHGELNEPQATMLLDKMVGFMEMQHEDQIRG